MSERTFTVNNKKDGRSFSVTVPEGKTEGDAIAFVKKKHYGGGVSINDTKPVKQEEESFSFWGGNNEKDERGFDPVDGFGEGVMRVGSVLRAVLINDIGDAAKPTYNPDNDTRSITDSSVTNVERAKAVLSGASKLLPTTPLSLISKIASDPMSRIDAVKGAWLGNPEVVTSFQENLFRKFEEAAYNPDAERRNPLYSYIGKNPKLAASLAVSLGLTSDIVVDPTTYVTLGGISAVTKPAAKLFYKSSPTLVKKSIDTTSTKINDKLFNMKAKKAERKVAKVEARAADLIKEGELDAPSAYWQAATKEGLDGDILADWAETFGVRTKWRDNKLTGEPSFIPRKELSGLQKAYYHTVDPIARTLNSNIPIWKVVRPLVSFANDIHPKLGASVTRMEYELATANARDFNIFARWQSNMQGLPPDQRKAIDSLLNSQQLDEAAKLMPKSMRSEFVGAVKPLLNTKYKHQVAHMGENVNYLPNYFPRSVKNSEGLMRYVNTNFQSVKLKDLNGEEVASNRLFEQMIDRKRVEVGKSESKTPTKKKENKKKEEDDSTNYKHYDLTPEQYGEVWGKFITRPEIKTLMSKPSFTKSRKIKTVSEDMQQFFHNSDVALVKYVTSVNSEIAKRNFFGNMDTSYLGGADETLQISNLVGKLREGKKITVKQKKDLEYALRARFIGGEQAAMSVIRQARAFGNVIALANPFSTATQIGDLPSVAYVHGVTTAAKAIAMVAKGKAPIKYNDTAMDLSGEFSMHNSSVGWIDDLLRHTIRPKAQAALDSTINKIIKNPFQVAQGGATDVLLQAAGFRAVDVFGKNSHLVASLLSHSKAVLTKEGERKFRRKFKNSFTETDLNKLVESYKNYGKFGQTVTDDMRYVSFAELMQVQPITLSNLPAAYLNHPNARILYSMKTFMLKQWDLLRNTALKDIKRGDYAKGISRLSAYGLMVGGTNGAIDAAKSAIRGDFEENYGDTTAPEFLAVNTMRILGANKYTYNKIKTGELQDAVTGFLAPPVVSTAEDIFKAVTGQASFWKAARHVPLTGKAMYYMFGDDANDNFGLLSDDMEFDLKDDDFKFKF